MSGLEEFYKKHSLANILTICIVVRIFADYFYLQVGKVLYEILDFFPLIIACMFGWKANIVALFPPICSNLYHHLNFTEYRELSTITAILLTNLLVDYLATKPFFKSDVKKLLLFEIGTLSIGSFIFLARTLVALPTTSPYSHFNTVYNFVFFMVMLIFINAKQNHE